MATFQGDFLSPEVQRMVRVFISQTIQLASQKNGGEIREEKPSTISVDEPSYIDVGLHAPTASPVDPKAQVVDVSVRPSWTWPDSPVC